ncbi:MAG: RsmB/NOP family class I SAM-dependent RNA methyltransferase, partial [Candidatus Bilamarchaeaceae archaeon]
RLTAGSKIIQTPHGHNFYGYFNHFFSWLIVQIEKFLALFTDSIIALTELEKKDYLEWLSAYTDAEACLSAQEALPSFIRANSLKTTVENYLAWTTLQLEPTFIPYAFKVISPPACGLGNTLDFAAGYIHTQSLSSMLPPHALAPSQEDTLLDICAAPGSKTTQCAALMQNRGAILANDSSLARISALSSNLERLGAINAAISCRNGATFAHPHKFSKALVDVPCSSLGSNPRAFAHWTPRFSKSISRLQFSILRSAFNSLEPGGVLVYSTCTYSEEENEAPVARLLSENPSSRLEKVGPIPHSSPGLSDYGSEFRNAIRLYPHEFGSEGFFLAKIRKG